MVVNFKKSIDREMFGLIKINAAQWICNICTFFVIIFLDLSIELYVPGSTLFGNNIGIVASLFGIKLYFIRAHIFSLNRRCATSSLWKYF